MCCSEPDVPETTILYVPTGVPEDDGGPEAPGDFALLLPPPHATWKSISANTSRPRKIARRLFLEFFETKVTPINPQLVNVHSAKMGASGRRDFGKDNDADAAVVLIFKAESPVPGNGLVVNVQLAPAGSPEHARLTLPVKPDCDATVTV